VRPALALTIALLALALAAPGAGAAPRRVPQGFVGMNFDPLLLERDGRPTAEVPRMAAGGVESVRMAVYWWRLQPFATAADVPPALRARFRDVAGVPTDFGWLDSIVAALAVRRIALLPTVLGAPGWARTASSRYINVPRDPADYAALMGGLVDRYGPDGSFWAEHPDVPRMPIRAWQVWNEPDNRFYWEARPFAASYVALLRAAREAIRAADPGATVVLASLTNRSWDALRALYAAGARGLFDRVALNAFTRDPADVLRVVALGRDVMRRAGDGALPIALTEVSWPSSAGRTTVPFFAAVTPRGQALRVRQALRLVAGGASRLGITGLYWYTWASSDVGRAYAFQYAGLRRALRGRIIDKPALAAFRRTALALEGCAAKARADRCARPAPR